MVGVYGLGMGGGSELPIGPEVVPFWGLLYRIRTTNPQKELLRGLWVIMLESPRAMKVVELAHPPSELPGCLSRMKRRGPPMGSQFLGPIAVDF